MDSPLTARSPEEFSQSSPNPVVDSLSKALRPIVYTPEICKMEKGNLSSETVVKQALCTPCLQERSSCTVQVQELLKQDSEDIECDVNPEHNLNTTVILYQSNMGGSDEPSKELENKLQSTSGSSNVLQRYFLLFCFSECIMGLS